LDEQVGALMAEYERARPGPRCAVGISEQRQLIEALRERGASVPWIIATVNKNFSTSFSRGQIEHHVRRACRCRP